MLTDAPSALTHLEGSASGETYDADRLAGLDPADGRPLLMYPPPPGAARVGHLPPRSGQMCLRHIKPPLE